MPKLYEYFGIIVFFYANEHEPIHVHGEYKAMKVNFKIVNGNLNWNDYEMIFPAWDLYRGIV
jgi:hypothetical protein